MGHSGQVPIKRKGAKETQAGDRKLEEEAAPFVPAQRCSYSNRQQGGKLEDWEFNLSLSLF